ncbi:hypothetical protein BRADI_1g77812v3 [Brachypodium distachyon]|uniref:Uncharacterized protein n=1 Tax=Brachypodium distachyon TaxID=15368 RepID=A0A0Q3KIK5_BRADI|nr:hypothetical protein BRADI_1g77812v3 [Brachypodium distachyon]
MFQGTVLVTIGLGMGNFNMYNNRKSTDISYIIIQVFCVHTVTLIPIHAHWFSRINVQLQICTSCKASNHWFSY